MENVFIVDALRTPIGRYAGALSSVRPDDLSALVVKALLQRNPGIDSSRIEDLIWGDTNQAGEDNRNVGRMIALLSGLPVEVAGMTVNRLCASGMQAIMDASRAIMLGDGEIMIAGGVESMSRAPFIMPKSSTAFGRKPQIYDSTIGWRFTNPKLAGMYYPYSMGETAENIVDRYHFSREEQDAFAHQSQVKYQQALEAGKWKDEIVPVSIKPRKGDAYLVSKDEHPRLTSPEKLASLRPAFRKNGSVTAGNSSGVNDGAAAVVLVSESYLKEKRLKAKARVVSMAVAGVNPDCMGLGPIPATRKALKRAGLSMKDIGLIELNEAFASQSLACIKELELNPEIVNVNGGAIALGHPLGCTGARITSTLLYEMERRPTVRYGLATLCIGVGQGAAIIYEKV